MRRTISMAGVILVLCFCATLAAAQAVTPSQRETSQGPEAPKQPVPVQGSHNPPNTPKAPDMVCFGYGPSWSIQFVNGDARYLGVTNRTNISEAASTGCRTRTNGIGIARMHCQLRKVNSDFQHPSKKRRVPIRLRNAPIAILRRQTCQQVTL
jgi:hypothetical protein